MKPIYKKKFLFIFFIICFIFVISNIASYIRVNNVASLRINYLEKDSHLFRYSYSSKSINSLIFKIKYTTNNIEHEKILGTYELNNQFTVFEINQILNRYSHRMSDEGLIEIYFDPIENNLALYCSSDKNKSKSQDYSLGNLYNDSTQSLSFDINPSVKKNNKFQYCLLTITNKTNSSISYIYVETQ